MDASQLAGCWTLVVWERIGANGAVSHPYSDRASGRIFYDANGLMGAFLMHPDWPRGETAAEPRFLSYSGGWELDGDIVNHNVDICSDPKFIGLVLRRRVVPDGERIALLTLPARGHGERESQHRLLWARAG